MDEVLELWPERPTDLHLSAGRSAEASPRRWVFHGRTKFLLKSGLLLVTTLALIPILLMQHALAAQVYLWFLVIVHVVGAAIFAWGVRRSDIAPTARGLWTRIAGLVALIGLLYLASQGLTATVGSVIFWTSLFAIWALHTGGLLMLHLRSGREQMACPFL